MNERHIASQIRFVFQSSSGHIPYWLQPNNLIRWSPPPFSSTATPPLLPVVSSSSFLSLSPKRNGSSALLSLLKKSWRQITLPDLKVEPLILMISIMTRISHFKKKRIGRGYIPDPGFKRYYRTTEASIWEKCQADQRVRAGKQPGKLTTLALISATFGWQSFALI